MSLDQCMSDTKRTRPFYRPGDPNTVFGIPLVPSGGGATAAGSLSLTSGAAAVRTTALFAIVYASLDMQLRKRWASF